MELITGMNRHQKKAGFPRPWHNAAMNITGLSAHRSLFDKCFAFAENEISQLLNFGRWFADRQHDNRA